MTAANWQVRDLTLFLRTGEMESRLEQARTDFTALMPEILYFQPSANRPGRFDGEYILTGQRLVYVYLPEDIARQCALCRNLPSNSSNCGIMATAIPPWLMDARGLNREMQDGSDRGGIVNYYQGPRTNQFFVAIMPSNCFVRFGTRRIDNQGYGFYARGGNYTEEGEDDDEMDDENEAGEAEAIEAQTGDIINYPIIALGSCNLSA
ncbi:RolB family protein [Agrobacterium radiobacter]|uniref:RolB family protein n=1 Tax=Agrobacterium radiobacter TaxID=362 RepID=UPI003F825745